MYFPLSVQSGFTPLHITAKHGHLNAARILLNHGKADVNAEGRNNLTPLHLACHYGSEDMVQEFLKYKVSLSGGIGDLESLWVAINR